MRFYFLIFIFIFHFPSLFPRERQSVFHFLDLPVSTRVSALGGQNVSIVEPEAALLFHNPSLLGPEMDMKLYLGFLNYLADSKSGSLAFAKSLGENSAWGVGINYLNYGSILETSVDNIVLGDLSANDMALNVFFSRDLLDNWRGGVTAKYLYSSFAEYTAMGLAVDLGLSYYNSEREFSLGLALKNLGRQVKAYHEKRESLPWDIQLGISQKLSHAPIRLSATVLRLYTWEFKPLNEQQVKSDSFGKTLFKHLTIGAEFLLSENLWLGLGFDPKLSSDMHLEDANKLGGFSAGGGFRVKAFDLGFALSKYHPSAVAFQLNIGISLGELNL